MTTAIGALHGLVRWGWRSASWSSWSRRRSSSRSCCSPGGSRAQARTAVQGVDAVRAQTDALDGVARINDSGVRILHSARALRKVAVGK